MSGLRSKKDIIYRKASAEDLEALCVLEQVCFPEEPWSRQMFSEELANGQAVFAAAELAPGYEGPLREGCGRLAGYVIAWVIEPYECQVGSIAVLPEFRRCGIASDFMGILIDVCAELKIDDIYLEVRKSNTAAQKLYGKFGFSADGLRKQYYQDGEDALTMARHETGDEEPHKEGI